MIHKIITFFLKRIDDIGRFANIVCAFFIMALALYWIETAIEVKWNWLNFLKPAMDAFLDISFGLVPLKLHPLVETFNGKFIIAIGLIACLMVILKYVSERLDLLKIAYDRFYNSQKLSYEKSFNKKLEKNIEKEQIKISKYMVWIGTSVKNKFTQAINKINIDEQNQFMNDFLYKKTEVKHQIYQDGFLYFYDDFNQIDMVLDALFKILKSNSPLDYKICIQTGFNTEQLNKLIELNNINKITTCADSVLRYKYNKSHRYGTQCMGVYQKDGGTIEVHEFHEIL